MPRILSVSYDLALARTRQLLLERERYEVVSARSLEASLEHCRRGGFDAFILGHSIPPSDKQRLVIAFKKHCPAPIISLSLTIGDRAFPGADFHVETTPELLLPLLARLLKGSRRHMREVAPRPMAPPTIDSTTKSGQQENGRMAKGQLSRRSERPERSRYWNAIEVSLTASSRRLG